MLISLSLVSGHMWIVHIPIFLCHLNCPLAVHLFIECIDGYFGELCMQECHCADGDICAKENGQCPSECAAGWNGTDCQDGIVIQLHN